MNLFSKYGPVFLLALLFSCVSKKPNSSLDKSETLNTAGITSVSKKESKAQYQFIKSEGLFLVEEYENALVSLDTVLVYSPENPVVYFKKSRCYEMLEDLGNAVLFAEKSIELNGQNKAYYVQLAHIYELEKEYLKAISVYENLVSALPQEKATYAEIAKDYALLSQESDSKYDFYSGKPSGDNKALALKASEEVAFYDGETVKYWSLYEKSYELSDEEFIAKQDLLCELNLEKQALLESIERVKNGHPEMLWNHVNLLLRVRSTDEAIGFVHAYETETVEEDVEKHRVLGILFQKNKQPGKAKNEFKEILEEDVPDVVKIKGFLSVLDFDEREGFVSLLSSLLSEYNSGETNAELKELEGDFYAHNFYDARKGKKAYEKALDLLPQNEVVYEKLIKLDEHLKDYSSLLKNASALMALSAVSSDVYGVIANAYLNQDQPNEAIAILHKGLEDVGDDYKLENEFYVSLAGIHEKRKDYDSLYYYIEKSLEYDINDGELINKYCQKIIQYNGDVDVARANGERMIRLYPNSVKYHKTYALVMEMAEEYQRALAYMEKVMELGDTSTETYRMASRMAEKSGDFAKATLYEQKVQTVKE